MAIQTYASVVNDVQVHVTGAPQPLIVDLLRQAAVQFCVETWCYTHYTTPVAATDGVAQYTYTLPTETEVYKTLGATYLGAKMTFMPYDDVLLQDPDYPTDEGTPSAYTTTPGDTSSAWLVPVPDTTVASALRFKLVLRPTQASTGLEELFFNKHRETIVHGAAYRLMMIPDRHWTDYELAKYHGMQFRKGVTEGSVDTKHERAEGQTRVQMRKFV